VNAKMEALLPPKIVQRVMGEAEVSALFNYKLSGANISVAGCKVRNGVVTKGSRVRVIRFNRTVYDGKSLAWYPRMSRC
jgi:translation initiation factor IF-2